MGIDRAPGPILRDEEILLWSERNHPEPMRLRRIEVWVEEKQDTLVFVNNHPLNLAIHLSRGVITVNEATLPTKTRRTQPST